MIYDIISKLNINNLSKKKGKIVMKNGLSLAGNQMLVAAIGIIGVIAAGAAVAHKEAYNGFVFGSVSADEMAASVIVSTIFAWLAVAYGYIWFRKPAIIIYMASVAIFSMLILKNFPMGVIFINVVLGTGLACNFIASILRKKIFLR
jgi:hypothetical protein